MFKIKDRINKFDRLMAAISFAEADEREIAMEVMGRDTVVKRLDFAINNLAL